MMLTDQSPYLTEGRESATHRTGYRLPFCLCAVKELSRAALANPMVAYEVDLVRLVDVIVQTNAALLHCKPGRFMVCK